MESVHLPSADATIGKAFSHPDRTLDDLVVIDRLLGRLRAALHSGILDGPFGDSALFTYEWEDDLQLPQRIIRRRTLDVRSREPLYVVGFFGQRRHGRDRSELHDLDRELVANLARHVDILCYYTSALEGGEFGNLVISCTEEARTQWNHDVRHAWAARELSPKYYRSVRLHNGVLETGLVCAAGARLTVTKYFDFDAAPGAPWRWTREWDPPLRVQPGR